MDAKKRRLELFLVWFSYGAGTVMWGVLSLAGRELSVLWILLVGAAAIQTLFAVVRALRLD